MQRMVSQPCEAQLSTYRCAPHSTHPVIVNVWEVKQIVELDCCVLLWIVALSLVSSMEPNVPQENAHMLVTPFSDQARDRLKPAPRRWKLAKRPLWKVTDGTCATALRRYGALRLDLGTTYHYLRDQRASQSPSMLQLS